MLPATASVPQWLSGFSGNTDSSRVYYPELATSFTMDRLGLFKTSEQNCSTNKMGVVEAAKDKSTMIFFDLLLIV